MPISLETVNRSLPVPPKNFQRDNLEDESIERNTVRTAAMILIEQESLLQRWTLNRTR